MSRVERAPSIVNTQLTLGLLFVSMLCETLVDVPGYMKVSNIKRYSPFGKGPRISEKNALRTTVRIYTGVHVSMIIDDIPYLIQDFGSKYSSRKSSVKVKWGGEIVRKHKGARMVGENVNGIRVENNSEVLPTGITVTHYTPIK